MIGSDIRILQEASTNQTVLTGLIDLDHTTRTREFRTSDWHNRKTTA
jgi:hypothetical protein